MLPDYSQALHFLQISALAVGAFYWRRTKPAAFRWLILLLFLTVLNESILTDHRIPSLRLNNNLLYNTYAIIDMLVLQWIFYQIEAFHKIRRFILFSIAINLIANFLEAQLYAGWLQMHAQSFRLYNISNMLICLYYFRKVILEHKLSLRKDTIFIFCTGLFVYHALLFINFTTVSIPGYWELPSAMLIFQLLQLSANLIYYAAIITVFLNSRKS